MRNIFCRIVIIISLSEFCISGCSYNPFAFKPYDYDKSEDAKVKVKKSGYSVGVRGQKIYLKKEFKVPEQ